MLSLWDSISQGAGPVGSFVERAGITDPVQIVALQALFTNAVTHGWWDKCDLIYPFVGGTALAHAQNLKSSSFTITWAGTVTHNANGITGNGTTGIGDTGYNPTSSGQIALNSAHLGCYVRSIPALLRGLIGAQVGADFLRLNSATPAGAMQVRANCGTSSAVTSVNNAFVALSRIDAANQHLFRSGVDNSFAVASLAIPNMTVVVLAFALPAAGASAANIAGATAGSGLTFAEYALMAADWQAFNTSLGRAV